MADIVVTRFAPSPTGYLHIGGARTALFNWLFARKTAGKFILRIEDTDTKRNTPTATRQVIEDLKWLGIDWDEGPEVGGPNGPYFQSQRKDIYDRFVKQLLDEQKAYYCFDTPEELQQMRAKAQAERRGFVYRRPEVFPTEDDAAKARAQGRPVTVRFAVPQDRTFVVEDVVRGTVSFNAGEFGDFIIQKSGGMPTYNFACVIDDELMGVTHVIRGQEHLMNTPAQQALQEALGFRTPVYAHMSVTVSETGGKLSKRERSKALRKAIKERQDVDLKKLADVGGLSEEQLREFISGKLWPDMTSVDAMAEYLGVKLPEINVVDFFKSGYLPEALVNFISLLGFSPGQDRQVMSVEELIDCFDLSRLTKSNSLFDRGKLLAFNTEHIRMVGQDKLLEHFKNYLRAVRSPLSRADDGTLRRILQVAPGARTLAQVEQKSRFLFLRDDEIEYDGKAVAKHLLKGDGLAVLRTVRERLAALERLTPEAIESMLRSLADEMHVGLGKVAQPLRIALCGSTVSLPIFDAVEMLGKERTVTRIDNSLKKYGTDSGADGG